MRRKQHSPKERNQQEPVYRRPAQEKLKWSGEIERLAWGGVGVGRAEDGRLILLSAPLALFPGEKVEAMVTWKPRHGEGQVTSWIRRDNRRARAACPVADLCGGCDLWEGGSHVPALKKEMVTDLLTRQLPQLPEWRWLEAPETAKRHRIQLHWNGKELGFHRRFSHSVVPVTACPSAAPALSLAIPRLREALEARMIATKPQRWELVTGTPAGVVYAVAETGRTWRLDPDGWHPCEEGVLHEFPVGESEVRLRHRAGGFFQVCPPWAWKAFSEILGSWKLEGETLFDLYGGVGFFSAMLGGRFQKRVLVENDEPAVSWARVNLQDLKVEATVADVAEWVGEGLGSPQDLILLDPPRTGLAPELCAKLQSAGTDRMVLVGCDGAAFCRDIRRLEPAWKLEALAVVDLFPLTHHVECVALLTRGC